MPPPMANRANEAIPVDACLGKPLLNVLPVQAYHIDQRCNLAQVAHGAQPPRVEEYAAAICIIADVFYCSDCHVLAPCSNNA